MRVTRSSIPLALVALSLVGDVAAQARTGVTTKGGVVPLPPGPHFVITVPLLLRNLPPEVNQYEVRCTVSGPDSTGRPTSMGEGAATGSIPPGELRVEATVDVFLRDPTQTAFVQVRGYQCELFLNGTASGHTQRYLGGTGSAQMPLAPGAPLNTSVRGPMPPG